MQSNVLEGGRNVYGHRVGILMIEGRFPRPPGAIWQCIFIPHSQSCITS